MWQRPKQVEVWMSRTWFRGNTVVVCYRGHCFVETQLQNKVCLKQRESKLVEHRPWNFPLSSICLTASLLYNRNISPSLKSTIVSEKRGVKSCAVIARKKQAEDSDDAFKFKSLRLMCLEWSPFLVFSFVNVLRKVLKWAKICYLVCDFYVTADLFIGLWEVSKCVWPQMMNPGAAAAADMLFSPCSSCVHSRRACWQNAVCMFSPRADEPHMLWIDWAKSCVLFFKFEKYALQYYQEVNRIIVLLWFPFLFEC